MTTNVMATANKLFLATSVSQRWAPLDVYQDLVASRVVVNSQRLAHSAHLASTAPIMQVIAVNHFTLLVATRLTT